MNILVILILYINERKWTIEKNSAKPPCIRIKVCYTSIQIYFPISFYEETRIVPMGTYWKQEKPRRTRMTQPSKIDITSKYQAKGAQQISYKDYLARQEKTKSKTKMPPALKYIIAAPAVLISCFGVFFIPFIILQAINSNSTNGKPAHTQISAKSSSHTSR